MASYFKAPRAIRLLTLHGADALKSSFNRGRYFGPLVSSRIAADIRKRSIVEGTFGTFVANEGGWDPSWDEPKKMYMLRPAKGHIRERNREQRVEKIDNAMKGMPDRLKKYKQDAMDRKPKKDIFQLMKRVATLSKDHGGGGSESKAAPVKKKK